MLQCPPGTKRETLDYGQNASQIQNSFFDESATTILAYHMSLSSDTFPFLSISRLKNSISKDLHDFRHFDIEYMNFSPTYRKKLLSGKSNRFYTYDEI